MCGRQFRIPLILSPPRPGWFTICGADRSDDRRVDDLSNSTVLVDGAGGFALALTATRLKLRFAKPGPLPARCLEVCPRQALLVRGPRLRRPNWLPFIAPLRFRKSFIRVLLLDPRPWIRPTRALNPKIFTRSPLRSGLAARTRSRTLPDNTMRETSQGPSHLAKKQVSSKSTCSQVRPLANASGKTLYREHHQIDTIPD